jgi:nucleotide-binding universal stress UspA family protein
VASDSSKVLGDSIVVASDASRRDLIRFGSSAEAIARNGQRPS